MKKVLLCTVLLLALLVGAALAEEALPEGDFAPERFTFSGGSGKVTITCPTIHISGGEVTADFVFSSVNYTNLRVDGTDYAPVVSEDSALFTVPVQINRAFEIVGTTTAMSRPHDVTYTVYIGYGEDDLGGLVWMSRLPLRYAACFEADFYEGGYALISVDDGRRYLIVPEGLDAPESLDPTVFVLRQPLDGIYVAASSAMALFDRLGALSSVRFSNTQASGWSVENAAEAMEKGDMLYAGKYSEPDYELLVREGCDLAIESTMILHTPKVQELIELLNIPVFIDRSSYEDHPLGRVEWIKVYGVMTGKLDEAQVFFDEQAAEVEAISHAEPTGLSVGFFYINTSGQAVIRGRDDYIPRMIEMGGGDYAFAAIADGDSATMTVTIEDFYAQALDADYLIYSTSIDTSVQSLDDLLAKNAVLADLRAVKEGHVYVTGRDLYQATDMSASMITDISLLLRGGEGDMTFLERLE